MGDHYPKKIIKYIHTKEKNMKIAVVGSRNLKIENLGDYLPAGTTEIVSGGARGIDTCAREYAKAHGLKLPEILPDYERYGNGAPLRRNLEISGYADAVLAFWDGKSRGTAYTIKKAQDTDKPVRIIMM